MNEKPQDEITRPLDKIVRLPYSFGLCHCCHQSNRLLRTVVFSKNDEWLDTQSLCMSCRTSTWHLRPGERMWPANPSDFHVV